MRGFTPRQWVVTGLLSAACLGTYFGLRALPVEACEILHYGDYLTSEGVIEGCGYEETGFFDLEAMRFPLVATLEPGGPVVQGRETTFVLHLRTSTGRDIGFADLAESHTARLHAMVVDASLEDYQHLHPQDGGAPGSFVFAFTPERPGTYQVYLDFIPLRTARRSLLAASFDVAPAAEAPREAAVNLEKPLRVRLVPTGGPLVAGETGSFRLEVEAPDPARPLRFDPVMDSYAHLVAFAPGRVGFAHFHPRNPLIDGQDPTAPDLEFLFAAEDPGPYRVWAQFSVDGVERFMPFDVVVAAGT